jgi:hypothetical protein
MTRTYEGLREFSWFGLSPNEVVAKMQPMTISQGPNPGFNLTPAGITMEKETGVDTASSGGFRGYGIAEELWTGFKSAFWFIAIGIGVLLIISFLPAVGVLAPIVTVAQSMLRALASVIPFVGSIVERVLAYFRSDKPLAQTISAHDAFDAAIAADTTFTPEQKAKISAMFEDAVKKATDLATQKKLGI